MKIRVNQKTVFAFPSRLLFNTLTAGIARKELEKEGICLTRKQTVAFIKALRTCKRAHPDWNLVEIQEQGGDEVIITF